MTVVSDLLGKRVTVSMWIAEDRAHPSMGDMHRILTGIVRGVSSPEVGSFTLLVQTEVVHRGTRAIGALSCFTVTPRGGCEIVPVPGSLTLRRYEALRDQRDGVIEPDRDAAILSEMRRLWDDLPPAEREIIDAGIIP